MKARLLFIAASLVILSGCASTSIVPPAPETINGKKISITKERPGVVDQVFHSKDLPGGIYAVAIEDTPAAPVYPNVTRMIRERLVHGGFKVVDKPEGASIGIRFITTGDIGLGEADAGSSEHTLTAGQIGTRALEFVGGGVGSLGWLSSSDYHAVLDGVVTVKPVDEKLLSYRSSEKNTVYGDAVSFTYSLEKGSDKAPSDAVLTVMIDEWIKHYLVLDTEPVKQ